MIFFNLWNTYSSETELYIIWLLPKKMSQRVTAWRSKVLCGIQWCTLILVIRLDTQKTHLYWKPTNYPIEVSCCISVRTVLLDWNSNPYKPEFINRLGQVLQMGSLNCSDDSILVCAMEVIMWIYLAIPAGIFWDVFSLYQKQCLNKYY